ncbi:hypothetical protein LXL04_000499 [Taraxacum kok-saghyz]
MIEEIGDPAVSSGINLYRYYRSKTKRKKIELEMKSDLRHRNRMCYLRPPDRWLYMSRSFENSYIPENPRTHKPLTFSKKQLRGAKNRSNISPVAKKNFRKNDFSFPKTLHMSLYNTYLKRFVKKNLKKNAKKKKKRCTYAQKIKKSCTYGSEVGFLKGITSSLKLDGIHKTFQLYYLRKYVAEETDANQISKKNKEIKMELDNV